MLELFEPNWWQKDLWGKSRCTNLVLFFSAYLVQFIAKWKWILQHDIWSNKPTSSKSLFIFEAPCVLIILSIVSLPPLDDPWFQEFLTLIIKQESLSSLLFVFWLCTGVQVFLIFNLAGTWRKLCLIFRRGFFGFCEMII